MNEHDEEMITLAADALAVAVQKAACDSELCTLCLIDTVIVLLFCAVHSNGGKTQALLELLSSLNNDLDEAEEQSKQRLC